MFIKILSAKKILEIIFLGFCFQQNLQNILKVSGFGGSLEKHVINKKEKVA
jgi:hypothetical protein